MGGCQHEPAVRLKRVRVPSLRVQIQIRIDLFDRHIDQIVPVLPDDADIPDIRSAPQDDLDLVLHAFTKTAVRVGPEKSCMRISGRSDHRCDIIHIRDIRIDVLIDLLYDLAGRFLRGLEQRRIGKIQGDGGHQKSRQQKGPCDGQKKRALDALKAIQEPFCRRSFFHLRFSFAYSSGVMPVAFLKAIPK